MQTQHKIYTLISGYCYKMKITPSTAMLFLYISINYVDCHQDYGSGSAATTQCPLWHFLNTTTQLCECYNSSSTNDIVKCTERGIRLRVGHCMTYEELEGTIYIVRCNYFDGNFSMTDNGRYIELPIMNASELNDYMCEPMNRKGRVCSECMEGFGPSIISFGIVCSNCTGMWYGVPLYLFLEFVPITVFYVIALLFRVNITSAPMVAYVFFSQIIVSIFLSYGVYLKFEHHTAYNFVHAMITFYGFWNLDFFRYILPPFCVSPELKHMHIILIDYVSAFYPLCLICITWIVIKLHFHNFKPVVWLWSKFSKCFRRHSQDQSLHQNDSLIGVFTTFFLLSFSKLVYTSSRILIPLHTMVYENYTLSQNQQLAEDPRIEYFGKEYILYALISIFIILLILLPPVLLLALYPIKGFRLLLFNLSTRTITTLNIFVEKYYSCYRDGTDGGKDMRSLASMYFILRVISILIFQMISLSVSLISAVILYTSYGIMIALVRPYKKTYMNIIDTLIMANLALLALASDKYYLEDANTSLALLYAITICVFSFLPLLSLTGFVTYRILRKIKNELDLFRTKKNTCSHRSSNETTTGFTQHDLNYDPELPDRVLRPQQYNFVKMQNFAYVDYVRSS